MFLLLPCISVFVLLYKAQASDLGQRAEPKDKKLHYNRTVNDQATSDQGKFWRD